MTVSTSWSLYVGINSVRNDYIRWIRYKILKSLQFLFILRSFIEENENKYLKFEILEQTILSTNLSYERWGELFVLTQICWDVVM